MGRDTENNTATPSNPKEDFRAWVKSLPKIDLHRHLEGSLRISTLAEVAQEHGIDLPSYDIEQLRPYVQITNDPPDFKRFLEKFKLLRHFYTSKEAVQRITHEAILDAAADNVRYLELRFNPVALSRVQNFALQDVVEWVMEATLTAQAQSGTRTCLIMQIGRDEPLSIAEAIVDLAIGHLGPLVRGIDLAGNEVDYPAERFVEPFRRAKAAGLHITVHAGEWLGAQSVYAAVTYLDAERIGHGIRVVEDSNIARILYDKHITLEVCPTSNIQTGAVHGFGQHPLNDLFNLRLPVTINTDDPSISDTTLSDEYIVAVKTIGMDKDLIFTALRYAVDAAFIPTAEAHWLLESFQTWLAPYPNALRIFNTEV